MKYRNNIEILGQILQVANGANVIMTKIMYKTFLRHTQVKEYLKTLIDNGFLSYDLTSQRYKITKKSMRLLQLYNQIDEMVNLSKQQSEEQPQQ